MSNTTPRAPTHTAIQVPSTAALFDTAHCAACHRFTLYQCTRIRVSRVRTYPHMVARAFPLDDPSALLSFYLSFVQPGLSFYDLGIPRCHQVQLESLKIVL